MEDVHDEVIVDDEDDMDDVYIVDDGDYVNDIDGVDDIDDVIMWMIIRILWMMRTMCMI